MEKGGDRSPFQAGVILLHAPVDLVDDKLAA
jgi:hypothetical protein